MLFADLRAIILPYCLIRQADGRYVITNREYKPLGFMTEKWVDYAQHPIAYRIKGLTEKKAAQLSARGEAKLDRIYLYNDGCVPTHSKQDMQAYLERLAVLASLKVSEEP